MNRMAGSIAVEVDGMDVDITKLNVEITTGRKIVKTMNRTGKARGYTNGISDIKITMTAVIPLDSDEPDWEVIEDATIVTFPVDSEERRVMYRNCFVVKVGEQYTVEGEAVRDIEMGALNKVKE